MRQTAILAEGAHIPTDRFQNLVENPQEILKMWMQGWYTRCCFQLASSDTGLLEKGHQLVKTNSSTGVSFKSDQFSPRPPFT